MSTIHSPRRFWGEVSADTTSLSTIWRPSVVTTHDFQTADERISSAAPTLSSGPSVEHAMRDLPRVLKLTGEDCSQLANLTLVSSPHPCPLEA